MRQTVKERSDFELEPPTSLKDIVRDELIAGGYDDFRRGKEVEPITDEGVDQLMKRIYEKIEKEALATYHSNEPWALRQWALSHILRDGVTEETAEIAHGLISPVIEWQAGQEFDPLSKFRSKLIADGKPEHSIRQYVVPVAKFMARKGRKRIYPDEDIIEHLAWLREEGYIKKVKNRKTGEVHWQKAKYTKASLRREYVMLQEFFRFLHGNRGYQLPVAKQKVPTAQDLNQPTLTSEQLETLIFSSVIDSLPRQWIVRLAVASIYGARVSELTDISVSLDGTDSSIFIRTRKGGERRRQPIPTTLLPLFAVPIKPMSEYGLYYAFRTMVDKIGMELPERAGWHSIRRRVVTDIYTKTNAKDLPIAKFFRWQVGGVAQLPTYVQVPMETSDSEILSQHPYVEVWENIIPLIMKLHGGYRTCQKAQELYRHLLKTGV
jgi:hypothetical protein